MKVHNIIELLNDLPDSLKKRNISSMTLSEKGELKINFIDEIRRYVKLEDLDKQE